MCYQDFDLWIKNGMLVTLNESDRIIPQGDLLIKDGRIAHIINLQGELTKIHAKKQIDATNCIILPGLVNGHTHLPMCILRGYSDDLPLIDWLFKHIFPAEARYMNKDTVYWASLLGCIELISSGITIIADGYFFEEQVAAALNEAGIRGILGQGVLDFPTPDVKDPNMSLKVAEEFIIKAKDSYRLITPSIFCHSPITVDEKKLIKAKEICDRYNVPFQIHLSETKEEFTKVLDEKGVTPTAYLKNLGILDQNFIGIHVVHVTDDDINILSQSMANVVCVPESNMKLSSGVCRVFDMIGAGIRPGIGTDSVCSNNNMDLFREMDTLSKLQKVAREDASALTAKDALKMATIWGARALGMGDRIGSLEVGKEADIIIIDTDKPHLYPCYDPYSTLVYSAKGSDVRDVIIGGEVIMEKRRILRLDVHGIMHKIKKITQMITAERLNSMLNHRGL